MATKRPKSAPAKDLRDTIVDAALGLAARRDWGNVTLTDIARTAKIRLADLISVFEDKEDIVAAYGRRIDRAVLESYPDGVPGSEDKDRLFEILMARFDRMNDDRRALVSIINAACRDPKQAIIGLPGIGRSMAWTLEACGIDLSGWRGAARIAVLSGVYLWVLRTWRDDDSADMARTMAALDRGLDKLGSVANMLGA